LDIEWSKKYILDRYETYPPERAYEIYEQWLCWKAMREARALAENALGREIQSSTNDA
jgi:hypothetical protein